MGVRLGFNLPSLIQRRIVGPEIDRCLQEAAVFIHGSDSEMGDTGDRCGSLVFMVH